VAAEHYEAQILKSNDIARLWRYSRQQVWSFKIFNVPAVGAIEAISAIEAITKVKPTATTRYM